jgi:hypothetical protein
MKIHKKITILLAMAFLGFNLYGQENGFTFRPFFGGGGATAMFS